MEIWDGYYRDGTRSETDLVRGEEIPEGLYHIVCEILVTHQDGEILLMQRDFRKPNYGGMEESSAGGSALKGEDPLHCAVRELREETGICCEDLQLIGTSTGEHSLYYNYLCITDTEKNSITLQEGETIAYRWISEEEFIRFIHSDRMIPSQKEHYTAYFRKKGYLI